MADTAGVFEKGINYADRFVERYSRRTKIPTVKYLDVKSHPTMQDHIIVLSSINIPETERVNTLIPNDLIDDMEDEIKNYYYEKAEKWLIRTKKKPIVNPLIQKQPDFDIPDFLDSRSVEYEEVEEPEVDPIELSESEGDSEEADSEGDESEPSSEENEGGSGSASDEENSKNQDSEDEADAAEGEESYEGEGEEEKNTDSDDKKNLETQNTGKSDSKKLNTQKTDTTSKWKRKITKVLKLTKEMKDRTLIYNKAVELFMEDKYKLFEYQKYDKVFKPDEEDEEEQDRADAQYGQKIKEPRNELSKEDFKGLELDGTDFKPMPKYESHYYPPVFTNKFQLSIWKLDGYGVVKIKDIYFTPESKRVVANEHTEFALEPSLDKQTMLIVEKDNTSNRETLVIGFEIYTLEIISEQFVDTVDETIAEERYYPGNAVVENSQYRGICMTAPHLPRITSWNHGKYLMVGTSATLNSKVYFKYRVYDTGTKRMACTIDRTEDDDLQGKVVSFSFDDDDTDQIHWAMSDGESINMFKVDMTNGEKELM